VRAVQRFDGRVALVTGAGSGIGRAIVARLVSEGATVVAVDVSGDGLAETAASTERPEAVLTRVGDVTEPATPPAAVQDADALGGLHLLVNNAGILRFDHTHELAREAWDRVLAVNLTGTFAFCQAALPLLLRTPGANIVNLASTAALFGHPWAAAYAASKGGVLSLTKTLAVEYATAGLRANAVCPGSIDTPITGAFAVPDGADPKLVRRIMSPTGMAPPDVVAAAVAYLGSDDGTHVNGAEIRIDGATHS
jgi:NAD(P)-dependent dehydrogenase (short-subunit alcohol dehydrogenase family)